MLNRISARTLAQIATCIAILALGVLDARAADELLKYPDLSGQWGRDMMFFEPPPSALSGQNARPTAPWFWWIDVVLLRDGGLAIIPAQF
jgi:hypothetical protein